MESGGGEEIWRRVANHWRWMTGLRIYLVLLFLYFCIYLKFPFERKTALLSNFLPKLWRVKRKFQVQFYCNLFKWLKVNHFPAPRTPSKCPEHWPEAARSSVATSCRCSRQWPSPAGPRPGGRGSAGEKRTAHERGTTRPHTLCHEENFSGSAPNTDTSPPRTTVRLGTSIPTIPFQGSSCLWHFT